MKTFYIAAIISAAATVISAVPVADVASVEARNDIEARDTIGEFCNNANFGGKCFTATKLHECYNAGGANNKISSLRTYGHTCDLYVNAGCTGRAGEFNGYYPTIPASFNDKFSSVRCRK